MTVEVQTVDLWSELEQRRLVARVLGSPTSRREIRRKLGLRIVDVAAMTGLSDFAIRRRENGKWRYDRRSMLSDEGWSYIEFLARAKGIEL
jgi:hypothetical protein